MHKLTIHDGVTECKRINPPILGNKNHGPTAHRKKCRGMSQKSARNLLKYLLRLEHVQQVYFVTLTYRKRPSIKESKRHLKNLFNGFQYVYPKFSAVWRMEFQQNGNQHFHMLLYPGETIEIQPDDIRTELRNRWSKICGDQSRNFLQNGTKVDRIHNLRSCKFYISLHHTKQNQNRNDTDTGRCWGIHGRRYLPESIGKHVTLQDEEIVRLKRIYRKITKARSYKGSRSFSITLNGLGSFTAFLEHHQMTKAINFVQGAFSPQSLRVPVS